jgi:protein-tyrosine-phosphatase
MSAAFFNEFADPKRAIAISAGTQPAEQVHPVVVEAMLEVGIDLRDAKPQKLTPELAKEAELLITMGCGDDCPYVPGLRRDDWPLADPKGQGIDSVGRLATRFERESWPCLRRSTFYVSTRRRGSNERSEDFSRISGDVISIS